MGAIPPPVKTGGFLAVVPMKHGVSEKEWYWR